MNKVLYRSNDTYIICGFPGVGKSTLYTQLKQKGVTVLDSDSSTFDKSQFPQNYLEHIKQVITDGEVDYLFVSTHEDVVKGLMDKGYFFNLVYPDISLKEHYINRYKGRGSPEALINVIANNWETWINDIESLEETGLNESGSVYKINKIKMLSPEDNLSTVLSEYIGKGESK